jgi:hypothetical protein
LRIEASFFKNGPGVPNLQAARYSKYGLSESQIQESALDHWLAGAAPDSGNSRNCNKIFQIATLAGYHIAPR